jgi:hypothetical protein
MINPLQAEGSAVISQITIVGMANQMLPDPQE